jgi:predicted alpha/beta-hydrolase family hydrolase
MHCDNTPFQIRPFSLPQSANNAGKEFSLSFILETGPRNAPCHLILAHGAGTGISSPFFASMTELVAEHGISVTSFEFEYMASRRTGAKRPPPKAEALTSQYRDVVRSLAKDRKGNRKTVIGGKSLGGRVASLIADELYEQGQITGLVCLGYPFHPPNTPEKLRTAHLETLKCPALIVQGERDPFGNRKEIEALSLSKTIAFTWADDGDHDFGPRGRSGFTRKGNLAAAADAIAAFIADLPQPR